MQITRPAIADYDEITQLWELSVRQTHNFLTEADIAHFKPLVRQEFLPVVDLFIIKENGQIKAFLGVSGDKVEMLFVHPDAFGKGYGTQLLRYAVNELHATKVDVNEQNPAAAGFYRHFGFQQVARSPLDAMGKPFPILHLAWQQKS